MTSAILESAVTFVAQLLHCHAGLEFSIEDLESGRFAHVAWVHGGLLDFRAASDERDDLYNRVGDPFVAIHLWSAESDVGKQVVLPFVKEFEPRLLNGDLTPTLRPKAQQSIQEDAAQSVRLGLDVSEASESQSLTEPNVSHRQSRSNAHTAGANVSPAASNVREVTQAADAATGSTQDVGTAGNVVAGNSQAMTAERSELGNSDAAVSAREAATDGRQAAAGTAGHSRVSSRARRRRQPETLPNSQ